MADAVTLPQHVIDTRYLHELSERILSTKRRLRTRRVGEGVIDKVGQDLEDASQMRWCDCDPDERWEEGFDEDSDEEDRWFCSYRSIKDQYGMHVVLEQARLDIEADPTKFPKAIYEEIVERLTLEHTKVSVAQALQGSPSDEQVQASPPPSPQDASVFPASAFQKLPPEIQAEIVLVTQASDPHAHIKLAQVDTSLRRFVNSTPLLWSRVDFLYPLNTVHLHLERSVAVLLRVTALLPLHSSSILHPVLQDVKEDETTRLKEFLRALRPHRHRIISLRLRFDDIMVEAQGENERQALVYDFLWDGSMVKLELLDLELDMWTWEGVKAPPSSRSIRELHLHSCWTKEYLPLFSRRLRSLVFTDNRPPFSMIFDALQAAPCLTSLIFRDMSFTEIAEKKGSVLALDHLESLELIRIVGSAAEALLNCIVAPNLSSIALRLVDRLHLTSDLTDINQLQLFPVPRPSVRHLDLTACDGRPSSFASAFRAFPYLTHLRITSSNLDLANLAPLAMMHWYPESGFQSPACPNLKHFTLDNEWNDIADLIAQILFERQNWGFPLESVTIRGIPGGCGLLIAYRILKSIVAKIEIAEFDQEVDVFGDSDDGSASETSSEGDWASGDEEIVAAFRKAGGAV